MLLERPARRDRLEIRAGIFTADNPERHLEPHQTAWERSGSMRLALPHCKMALFSPALLWRALAFAL
jgi:hypothetical protein